MKNKMLKMFFLSFSTIVAPDIGVGQTVAGFCNDSIGGGSSGLQGPWGIYVSPSDGILYVTDYDLANFQAFPPFSRNGRTLLSTGLIEPMDIFVDGSDTVYMTDNSAFNGIVYVQQTGINLGSFPVEGQSTADCFLTGLYGAYGVAVDRSGNIYVGAYGCCMVVKWTLNATIGVLVAGQPGTTGSTSNTFQSVRFIYLDDDRGLLYVCDTSNNRIQQFIIGGNGTGVTVAGKTTAGTGLNQLNQPGGIWVTQDGQTLYVADYSNNRVMKWTIGASEGSVFAGDATGVAGSTNQLLNEPGDVALDPTETYLYVSDYSNHRVQRFRIR
jgi:DNA-binding beta-propeller fold protein YncE